MELFAEKSLLLSVVQQKLLTIVDLLILLVLSVLSSMESSEFSWAPHLVGIQLVRASELVTVGLLSYTVKQGISSFEAKFLVESELLVVSTETCKIVVGHYYYYLLL